ncbi:MAG TPA: DoxX family protein [Terriglobales bacterium]|nr:DoxX family protein [Terriglobales bacterium]
MNLQFLDRLQPLGLLVLRVVLGAIMIGHGYGKVFGGLSRHVGNVAAMGMPGWLGYLSAGAEFVGGMLLVAGLLTRFAAVAVCINMLVAVFKVHWKQGLLGGYEFPLALAAMAFALIFMGAGSISIDWVIGGSRGSSRR